MNQLEHIKSIQPSRDHILIKTFTPEAETTTNSGIIIKSSQTERCQTIAEVVAVGEGRILEDGKIIPLNVKPGDQVIYYDFAGVMIKAKDQEANVSYLIIKQNDIIAIINKQ